MACGNSALRRKIIFGGLKPFCKILIYNLQLWFTTVKVDRYISLPGQATAYKIGERKFKEVRSKLEKEEGKGFDVRKFHFLVLNCVGYLETLEECVRHKSAAMQQEQKAEKNSATGLVVVNANLLVALTVAVCMRFV